MCRRDTFRVKSLCQNGDKFCVGEQFVRCENTGSRSRISAYAADGSVYEGEWDQETGYFLKRTIKYADGAVYEGEWKNDKYNGQGTQYLGGSEVGPDVDFYVGEFVDGYREGHGTYTWVSSGDTLEGTWVDSKTNGILTYTYADGTVVYEEYDNGTLIEKRDKDGNLVEN